MQNPLSVNLLKGSKKSFLDKFITWALTLGRLIVIITEVIALTAFLYRFFLDRQLIDLHDKIKQKQAIVSLLKTNEDKYRSLQDRLTLAAKLSAEEEKTTNIFSSVTDLAPDDIKLDSITLSDEFIKIEANAQSAASVQKFITALKKNPFIHSVSLDKIANKTSAATISITLTAIIKTTKQ